MLGNSTENDWTISKYMPHGCILHVCVCVCVFLEGAFIITHSFVGLFIQSPDQGPALSLHHRSGWIHVAGIVSEKKERGHAMQTGKMKILCFLSLSPTH